MQGLLLINLGTPDAPNPKSVKKYLKEFLMDPQVINLPFISRWFLVNGIIIPFRSKNSAEAYQKIWTKEGSPLLTHSLELESNLQKNIGTAVQVRLAMRYGKPKIESTLIEMTRQGVTTLKVIPLYPQYSLSATQSSIDEVNRILKKHKLDIETQFVSSFYSNPHFIDAFADRFSQTVQADKCDFILFSYHGLPEDHITPLDPSKEHCLKKENCCEELGEFNQHCYRFQCYETTRQIAKALELKPESYTTSFQSRLGRKPWIRPYTDHLLTQLAEKGVKKLVVVCPSFVADCLETLEEIEIRGKEDFIQSGGKDLILVPSLNSSKKWSNALVNIMNEEK